MSRRGERGTILILSLWVVALLSLLALSLVVRVRAAVRTQEWQDMEHEGRELLTSLGELAIERLRADADEDVDGYGDPWGRPVRLSHLELQSGFDGARPYPEPFSTSIQATDECGKVNVNRASIGLLTEILREAGAGVEAEAIARAIADWRDADNLGDAEDGYYETLPRPYGAANADVTRIEELLFVRGVTPTMWFGEDANRNGLLDPEEDDGPLYPPLDNGDGQLQPGLADLLTAQGDGTVNVNTAPPPVLRALLAAAGVDAAEAARVSEAVVKHRRGADGVEGTEDDRVIAEPAELTALMGEAVAGQLSRLEVELGFASTAFRMHLRVEYPERHAVFASEFLAIRDPGGLKVIEWQDDFT